MSLVDFDVAALKEGFALHAWTLGFAESCTGGLMSASLARHSGVSSFFKGSVVSYAGSVKSQVLGVQASTMLSQGQVSRQTAKQMVEGARQVLDVDWAVSVTGIAGPSGGTVDKPVGTVCFGISGPGFAETYQQLFKGNREEVQQQAAQFGFELLLKALGNR
ncbi:MAG: damage-inducible protein CinA [Bdellovibrionaceae bacterium]|nr:damage-inducible protein CinA [Pseudobdellovibrionaceae bacterium]